MYKNSVKKMVSFLRRPIVLVVLGVLVIAGFFVYKSSSKAAPEMVEVKRGTIVQEVSVTGQVVPAQDLKLSFEKSGKVVGVYKAVGDRVSAGQPIVALSSSQLSAQLLSAEANVAAAEARLDALKRGARPEELALKQTALEQANLTLKNNYANVFSTIENSYISADDAVRKQLDSFFTNDETLSASLVFQTSDSQAKLEVESGRYAMVGELNSWRDEIAALNNAAPAADIDTLLAKSEAHLAKVQVFLRRVSDVLIAGVNLTPTSITAYQTSLTAARTEISASLATIGTAKQTISSGKLSVTQAENDLALAEAGTSQEDIRVQQAQVDAAVASVAQIKAQIGQNYIYAPINGIVTVQSAKVGQIVSPSAIIVEMISDAKFQIEANIPETDIGRVKVGNTVGIVLDAFPGEKFEGKVVSVDPAKTVIDGAVNFKIKIVFSKADPRIRSGFTANLGIQTATKEKVLFLPQYAILQNDDGIFVEIVKDGKTVKEPVKLGIRDKDGLIEIISGIEEGQRVLNVGLKSDS